MCSQISFKREDLDQQISPRFQAVLKIFMAAASVALVLLTSYAAYIAY
jgi:hypothetical protein